VELVKRGTNWSLPFHISIDSSYTTIGALLGQQEKTKTYAIYYTSKNLALAELNYIVMENEFFVVVHAINKFRHYIIEYPVFLHTNHASIR